MLNLSFSTPWSRIGLLSLLLGLAPLACTHDGQSASSQTQGTELAAASTLASCDEKSFCTREYQPTSCQFAGQSFQSSNRCEALKLARRFACEKKLGFAVEAVVCKATDEASPM